MYQVNALRKKISAETILKSIRLLGKFSQCVFIVLTRWSCEYMPAIYAKLHVVIITKCTDNLNKSSTGKSARTLTGEKFTIRFVLYVVRNVFLSNNLCTLLII